jgi:hypothetical protein
MPHKDPKNKKQKGREYYHKNKDKISTKDRERYWNDVEKGRTKGKQAYCRRKQLWREFIVDIGYTKCSKCGYSKCPAALEFHHTDLENKEIGIGQITREAFTPNNIKRFLDEIDKCILVCCRCHREIHWGENNED